MTDAAEPRIRELLAAYPTMPATVIAERIEWDRSIRVLRDRVAQLRPAYLPPDPASRTAYAAGEIAQCDFWFPPVTIPAACGLARKPAQLPVLTMVCAYSRWLMAVLIPPAPRLTCSRAGGSTSRAWARCRGCWSGTARARSAGSGPGNRS